MQAVPVTLSKMLQVSELSENNLFVPSYSVAHFFKPVKIDLETELKAESMHASSERSCLKY